MDHLTLEDKKLCQDQKSLDLLHEVIFSFIAIIKFWEREIKGPLSYRNIEHVEGRKSAYKIVLLRQGCHFQDFLKAAFSFVCDITMVRDSDSDELIPHSESSVNIDDSEVELT